MFTGPNTITNGLILSLDAANRKSYISGSTTWFDLSGNNNSGSLTSPTYSSMNGGLIQFNGSSTRGTVSNIPGPSFSFVSNSFSVGVWFNYASSSAQMGIISSNQSPVAGGQYEFSMRSGNVFKVSFYGEDQQIANYFTPQTWYQVVHTYDLPTSASAIYINGILNNTITRTKNLITSGSLTIGWFDLGGSYLTGSIANIQLYNRVLSPQEVLQNYNATKTRFGL